MSEETGNLLSEEEAKRLWKRAVELQTEASQRVEERSKGLTVSAGLSPHGGGDRLAVPDVLAAGEEVGIDPRFLNIALAELHAERASPLLPTPDLVERVAHRFLGNPPSAVDVTRVFDVPGGRVYEAMQRVFPASPYHLRLRSSLGQDPLDDAVLVFDAPSGDFGGGTYSRDVLMAGGRIRRIYVTTRRLSEGDSQSSSVTIRGPVEADHEPAFWLQTSLVVVAGAMGLVLGALAARGMDFAGLAGYLTMGGTAVAAAGGVFVAFRERFLAPFQRSVEGLQELLDVVEATIKTGGVFIPGEPAHLPNGSPSGASAGTTARPKVDPPGGATEPTARPKGASRGALPDLE